MRPHPSVRTPMLVTRCSAALAVTTAVALLAALLASMSVRAAHADEQVARSAGPERIATAVAASRDHRAAADEALIATATSFPDALAAGALAADLDAPLLLTHRDSLGQPVLAELERLGVSTVWLLGGTAVIGPEIAEDLADRGFTVRRIAGGSRYDTAREIALAAGPAASGEVVVALGEHPQAERAWPDAVAAGALAASPDRLPILLTAHDTLPEATEAALAELGTRRVLLVGGTAAIDAAVERQIRDLGYDVARVAGSSRYETSVLLAEDALQRSGGAGQTVVFATGEDFPDALAAGALAGTLEGPLVLVPSGDLTSSVERFLRTNADRWDGGVVVGGQAAASDAVLAQLTAAVNDRPAPAPPEPVAQAEPEPPAEEVARVFEGQASWYGPGFHGRTTANGETFDRHALTAAHRTLPFGTRVRVTNLRNGEVVTVRINDRGPFAGNRVIDLSERSAGDIGMISSGTAPVRVEVLR